MNSFIAKDLAEIIHRKRFLKWIHSIRNKVNPEYFNILWSIEGEVGWRLGRKMKINWRQFDLHSLRLNLDMFCIYNIYYGCYCTVLPNRYFYYSGHLRNAL
jgi:hypothetical protein